MQPNNPYGPGGYSQPGSSAPQQQYGPAPKAKSHKTVWILSITLLAVLVVVFAGLFFWAFSERQSYKNDVDQKIAAATEVAIQQNSSKKDAEFTEREKQPLKDYEGQPQYGSLIVKYPKTWGAYISEKTSGSVNIDGYAHPDYVPGTDSGASYAVRFQVVDRAYDQELKQFDADVKKGIVTVNPYRAPQVPGVLGSRIDGEIVSKKRGSMILVPLRDKTLKVWTESEDRLGDFNDIILANVSFSP